MKLIALEEAFAIPTLAARFPAMENVGNIPFSSEFTKRIAERLPDFVEHRIPDMDRHGVDMQVLSLTVPGVQADLVPEDALEVARSANDHLASVVAEHPTRFAGLAAVPLQDPAAGVAELRRAVSELGLRGALVNDHTQGHYLDDERYEQFWSTLEELDVPLYIHPGAPKLDHWLVEEGYPELAGATWSWASEVGGHALRLVFGGVFDRHPNAHVILGHMGEFLPFMRSRLDSRYEAIDTGRTIKRRPSEYIGTNISITISGVPSGATLAGAVQEIGADAIMFAIDYPYEYSELMTAGFAAADLSDEDRQKISHGTAERLLKLPTE